MERRQVVLTIALGAVVLLGTIVLLVRRMNEMPHPSAVSKPHPGATAAEFDEIRKGLDAERLDDKTERCQAYPNPAGLHWDTEVTRAVCRSWDLHMIGSNDIRAALDRHHPEIVDEAFRSYLEKTFTPGQHGYLSRTYDWMFYAAKPWIDATTQRWVEEDPRSPFALTARGLYLVAAAYQARGTKFARDTSEIQFMQMRSIARKALSKLNEALEIEPRLMPAYYGLIDLSKIYGDPDLLDSTLKKALAADAADESIYSMWMTAVQPKWGGSLSEMQHVADEAYTHVRDNPLLALLQAQPYCYSAEMLTCRDCGNASSLQKRQAEALRLFLKGVDSGPAECALRQIGGLEELQGNQVMTVRFLSQAYRFFGGEYYVERRALALQGLGKGGWGLEELDRIAARKPQDAEVRTYRGWVLEAQHRYDEAQQAFAAAHVADPHNWDATRSLFNAYSEELHQPEKAREVMEEMRRVAPDDPRIWLLEAASHKKGEEAQCRDALKKFLELTAGKPAGVAPWEIDRVRRRVAELDKLLGT